MFLMFEYLVTNRSSGATTATLKLHQSGGIFVAGLGLGVHGKVTH